MRLVFILILMLGWVSGAWAQVTQEHPGRIGIWAAPGKLGDTGDATAPADFTVTGDLKVAKELFVIANKTGALQNTTDPAGCIKDACGDAVSLFVAQTQPTYNVHQIDAWALCAPGCVGINTIEAVSGVGVLTPGSAHNFWGLVNAVGGHVVASDVKDAPGGFPTAVSLFGVGVADTNNSAVWGLNTLLTDNRGQAVSAGTGKELRNEFDFNVTSPDTVVFGVEVQGASLAQPKISNAFVVGGLNLSDPTKQWGSGLQINDNATFLALNIGVGGPSRTSGTPSQKIQMNYMDTAGTERTTILQSGIITGQGGGVDAFYISNLNPVIPVNLGVHNGGLFTNDSPYVTNGLLIGAQNIGGVNIPSQYALWHYYDGGGVSQSYVVDVDSNRRMQFLTTAGATGTFEFQGHVIARAGYLHTLDQVSAADFGGNGLSLGSVGTVGPNLPSQQVILGFSDTAGVRQNYHFSVDATQTLVFGPTGALPGKYDFFGTLMINGVSGATCGPGAPSASFQVVGGLVTQC